MRYLLILLLLLLSFAGRAQTIGTIYGADIQARGWVMDVYVYGVDTNGTFAFGLGTNNSITGTQKVTLTVTSQGFDDTGTATTIQRTIYGTKQLRLPYPNHATNDVWTNTVIAGSVVRIILSDYVYAGDSNLTVNFGTGWYSWLGADSVATNGMTVTNSSTETYPLVIANNSRPAYELASGSTHRVGVLAFQAYGQEGRPVRVVKFVATDGTTSLTNYCTAPRIDRDYGDAVPFAEYYYDVPLASLNSSNTITVNWQAYPWVGTNVCSTYDGKYSFPHWNYSPTTFVNNNAGTYPQVWANVATTGDDATGVATNAQYWTTNLAPFRWISTALIAIQATNNVLNGRNDPSAGIVYLEEGTHYWTNAGGTLGNSTNCWVTITKMPHAARENVIITQSGILQDIDWSDIQKFYDVSIDAGDAWGTFRMNYVWFDECNITSPNYLVGAGLDYWWVTRSRIGYLNRDLAKTSGMPTDPKVRGCELDVTNSYNAKWLFFAGNKKTNCVSAQNLKLSQGQEYSGSLTAPMSICFNNYIVGLTNTASHFFTLSGADKATNWVGAVIANNVFEMTASTVWGCSYSDSAQTNVNNVLIWNNSQPGMKMNWFYSTSTTFDENKRLIFAQNNFMDDANIKSDNYSTPCTSCTNNWSVLFGVGCWGNVIPETYNVGGDGEAIQEFIGLNSWSTSEAVSTTNTWPQFVDRQAMADVAGIGGGNYRIQSSSPLLTFKTKRILSHDIEGVPRSAIDPPGAYASGNPRKGAMLLGF